jgi:hypothetical protein
MKFKIKVTRQSTAIIEVDSDNYPEGVFTEEEMMEYDKASISEDPSIMDDWLRDDEITIEKVQ